MNIKSIAEYLFTLVLIAACFALGYFLPGDLWLYWRRAVILVLLLLAGYLLPSLNILVIAFFALVSDAFFIEGPINALDLLVWAAFVLVPLFGERLGRSREESQNKKNKNSELRKSEIKKSMDSSFLPGRSAGNLDEVVDKTRNLLLDRFKRAAGELNLANLIYYHVRSKKATLGYTLNRHGDINRDCSFTPDIGQSVGWVLRHEKSLSLQGQSLDWRNLQYHTKPVSLQQVEFYPVSFQDELIGVLVLEWIDPQLPDEGQVKEFVGEVKKMFGLDYSVRDLVRSQQKLKLLEKLYTVNPLAAEDFSQTVNRALEYVRNHLPADNVTFFRPDDELAEISPPARRKIYESCRQWILNSGEILRIDDVRRESLSGGRLDKFGQAELISFLGGAIEPPGEDCYGLIFLDASEPDYFSRSDEKIFKLLLNYLEDLLEVANEVRLAREDRSRLLRWVEEIGGLRFKPELQNPACDVIDLIQEYFSPGASALYHRNKSYFKLVYAKGTENLAQKTDVDASIVNRVAGTKKDILTIPDATKFKGFEPPMDSRSMAVLPIFGEKNRLEMFLCLFFSDKKYLDSSDFDVFKRTAGLINRWLRLSWYAANQQLAAEKDTLTNYLNYKAWRRRVAEKLQKGPEKVVFWELEVPGLEMVGRECGRKKAVNWLRSIARLLEDELPRSLVCRPYGGAFYGFQVEPGDEISERLDEAKNIINDWSFPTGRWPHEIFCQLESLSPPFPKVEKIIDSLHYSRMKKEKRKSTGDSDEKA